MRKLTIISRMHECVFERVWEIVPYEDRDIRALTRAREKLVNNSTQMKNRIHKELESACIKISSVLTDIFGVSGKKIINGLLEGTNIDEILKMITSKRILTKEQEIRQAVKNSLDPARILLIRTYLELIEKIESQIEILNKELMNRMQKLKEDLEIAMSMTNMGFTFASTILAECGLTPKVYNTPEEFEK